MTFPKRDRNHILEKKGSDYLRRVLPEQWYLEKPDFDYGIDFNCSVVENYQVNGVNFSIQLKSMERRPKNGKIIVKNIKRSSIEYWYGRLEPVMIVAYMEDEQKAYFGWVRNQSFDLTKTNKTYQIEIPQENDLENVAWDDIVKSLTQIFSRKHHLYEMPKKTGENDELWKLYFDGEYSSVIPMFNKLIKEHGDDSLVYSSLANCYYQGYEYKKALVTINKAIDIESNSSLLFTKASILTEYGQELDDDEMLLMSKDIWEDQLCSQPSDQQLLFNYANNLRALKLNKEAVESYRKALDLEPYRAEAWKNLGSTHHELKEYDLEMICYDNALKINPSLTQALFSKGATLFKVFGKIEEGLEYMLKAVNGDKECSFELSFPHVYLFIAEAYLRLGDLPSATEWHSTGLENNPTDQYFLMQKERIDEANENQ